MRGCCGGDRGVADDRDLGAYSRHAANASVHDAKPSIASLRIDRGIHPAAEKSRKWVFA